jgi:RNA polymerase sigma factor (sigma-70 family)
VRDPRRNAPLTEEQKARVESSVRLAWWYAHRVKGKREPVLPLYGACCEGLVRAAQTFDPGKAKWSTYAYVWMRHAVQDLRRGYPRRAMLCRRRSLEKSAERVPKVEAGCLSEFEPPEPDSRAFDPDRWDPEVFDRLLAAARNDVQRKVLRMRFVEGLTLQEIADRIGRCRERVRQIEEAALGLVAAEAVRMGLAEGLAS